MRSQTYKCYRGSCATRSTDHHVVYASLQGQKGTGRHNMKVTSSQIVVNIKKNQSRLKSWKNANLRKTTYQLNSTVNKTDI